MGNGKPVADRLDRADEVAVLRRVGESGQLKPPDRQEDAARLAPSASTAASMSGTEVQRSPGCGRQLSRRIASSGTPSALQACSA